MFGKKKADAEEDEEEFGFGDVDTGSFASQADDRESPPTPRAQRHAASGALLCLSPPQPRTRLSLTHPRSICTVPEQARMGVGRRASVVATSMFAGAAQVDSGFEIQKTIQLSGTDDAPMPKMDFMTPKRELDSAQYPGAEYFTDTTAYLAIDGVPPDARTTAAANSLRAMMGACATVGAAVTELQTAATAVARTMGKVGSSFEASTGGVVGAAFSAVGPTAVPPLERGLQAARAQAEAGAREVEGLRVVATERQQRFGQFEAVRQEVLGLLQRPSKGVGAVAKMQLKDEALRTVHASFKEADERLISLVNAKQVELGGIFGRVMHDATQVLAQFCGQTAQTAKQGAAPGGGGGGAPGGAATGAAAGGGGGGGQQAWFRINRAPGQGLGIILKTTRDGNAICEAASGAAAHAGVVAGCVVLAVAGVPVEGRGEGAVVAEIKGLPAGSPVDLVLRAPAQNWQATLR